MPQPNAFRVSFQLRIAEQLQYKLKAIAEEENRNLNSQIEYFLKHCVREYEEQNGPIDISSYEGGD